MTKDSFDNCCEAILNAGKKHIVCSVVTAIITILLMVIYCAYLVFLVFVKGTNNIEITLYAISIILITFSIGLINSILVHRNIRKLFKRQEIEGVLAMLRPYVAELNKKFYLFFKPFHSNLRVKIQISEDEFFTYHKEFVKAGDDNYLVFTNNQNLFERNFEVFYET